ncbi:hypothetical protein M231_06547 [Tremella mesenterica]|uniref:Uncharacterized protein n=1 Tax=Tremella mesenterica TaxID=5217 RepID=A0A4Q1BGA3_TREME|nr:uncharacterized protein TREMEDRAFT_58817 [Tremella mesenterica DSM 1558]EIW72647.1 hypothetical protein TREMEDRAFT_58817 [Tremella mesenterica DSM 1558]RXK36203.1 hypothetical protein M231_06547 [Tremella mesenterica]
MPSKRSHSVTSEDMEGENEEEEFKPSISPSPPITPKKTKVDPKSPKSKTPKTPRTPKAKIEKGENGEKGANGVWTSEKKGEFMDEIIAVGYKNADLDSLATKLGMNKRQLIDQLVPNRSNLRGRAVKAISVD